jgi:hypothetical protein
MRYLSNVHKIKNSCCVTLFLTKQTSQFLCISLEKSRNHAMKDIKKYFDRLQIKLGDTHSADKILEGPWLEGVVRELNLMSYHCARELQLETRQPYFLLERIVHYLQLNWLQVLKGLSNLLLANTCHSSYAKKG